MKDMYDEIGHPKSPGGQKGKLSAMYLVDEDKFQGNDEDRWSALLDKVEAEAERLEAEKKAAAARLEAETMAPS